MSVFRLELSRSKGVDDDAAQLDQAQRLSHETVDARHIHSFLEVLHPITGRDENTHSTRRETLRLVQQFEPAQLRHHSIRKHGVEHTDGQGLEARNAVVRGDDVVVLL